jgi:DNA-binding NtrC family response regulator
MGSLAERFACPALPISQATLDTCTHYSWPGNIRELENFVKRCLVLQEFTHPGSDAGFSSHPEGQPGMMAASTGGRGLKSLARSARENAEANAIIRTLQQTNWNRKQAAEQLKISYKALLYKIREYEIELTIAPVS